MSSSIKLNQPLNLESIAHYLETEKLSSIPDVNGKFEERNWVQRHLATSRCSLATSLLGRVALAPPCLALGIASFLSHKAGFEEVAKKTFHVAGLLSGYTGTGTALKPLVRTINKPQEKDWADSIEGVCAGSSLYFNFLYSKLAQSASPQQAKQLLIRCANLFVEGAGEEAVKLHKMFGNRFNDLVQEKGILTLTPDNERSFLEKGVIFYKNSQAVEQLPKGSYCIKIHNSAGYHAMSLIKVSENQLFIFDPAKGLFEFEGEKSGEQISAFLNQEYQYSRKYLYLQYLRREKAVHGEGVTIHPSELEKMYVHILPLNGDRAEVPSLEESFERAVAREQASRKAYRIGCWEYVSGSLVDSVRASSYIS